MNARDRILAALRKNQPAPDRRTPRPQRPVLFPPEPADAPPLLEPFIHRLEEAGGEAMSDWAALADRLRALDVKRGYVEPAFMDAARSALGAVNLTSTYDRAHMDEIEFSITPAAGAIAETGSLILTADTTEYRLAALTPWIHVAVLDPGAIIESTAEAAARFGSDRSVLWVTGPSKTADIEGVLVRGVHGPGIQLCLLAQQF